MSFLTPLFLLGGFAIALPVIFHLIRRTTRERTAFSSLMFLFPTPPRLTKRSRLEHLLLLLLRCLVLCLLAAGFARPFIKKAASAPPPSEARRVLLLVDTSASMRRANLWSDARDKIQAHLRRASPLDQIALVAFDLQLHPLVTFEQWNSTPLGERSPLALRKLAETSPGWSATRLDSALIQAAEILADNNGKPATSRGEIILIGDLQEGSHFEQLQGYEWPRNIKVAIEPLKPRLPGNASIQLITESDDGSRKADGVRVRVSNTADSKREQFKVGWTGSDGRSFAGSATEAYVPPGQSRVVTLPMPAEGTGASRIMLQGDEEDFDNVAFTTSTEKSRTRVIFFGKESATDPKQPLYFLQRAFQETRRQIVEVKVVPVGGDVSLAEIEQASLMVMDDALPEATTAALHAQILAGKNIVCLLKDEATARTLGGLAGGGVEVRVEEARPSNYAMLTDIDFRDPLFAPFADTKYSDFTKVHFWRYRRIDLTSFPNSRVLAKFDNGDPAIFELAIGKGHILVLTSGWHPEDSQLALSTKFVPLLYSILEMSGASIASPSLYRVGDTIPIPSAPDSKIIIPGGAEVKLSTGQTNFSETATPGLYTLVSGQLTKRFAVNLDASESRTAPFSAEEFERLGVPISAEASSVTLSLERKSRLQNTELENQQKLWRWLLLSALAVLLLETWLAGRAARRANHSPASSQTETGGEQLEGAYR